MPLRELMRNFFDDIKSATSGYASISYEPIGMSKADVVRLDILVADESVPAFTRVVSRTKAYEEAEQVVEKLHKILPKQLFITKVQGKADGRLASRTVSALKKTVTAHLSGGDISRKKKLWEQQKEGKKRMLERGRGNVNIPQESSSK